MQILQPPGWPRPRGYANGVAAEGLRGAVGIGGGTPGQPQRGYFLDPTPDDYAEFVGPIRNAFAADALSASPAFNRPDFYSLVAHEIAHTLGMSNVAKFNNQADPTTTSDPQGNGSGFFWAFDGAQVRHLMTSFNGTVGGGSDAGAPIHTASVGANINFNSINWRGAGQAALYAVMRDLAI